MKNSISKIITLLFIATIFSSCGTEMFNQVNGNRNVVTVQRKASAEFTKIIVSTGIDLYVSQGSKHKITVEADENLHDIIITEIDNGVLKIYADKNIWRAKARKVYVTIVNLESLKATSGSDVYNEDVIKTNDISIAATSGANIRFSLDAVSVKTSATSGSDIKVSGRAVNYTASATSGSSINAYELKSTNATARATSGADINIYAVEKLDAIATSGGDIDYKGNPKNISKKSNSGGSISKK